MRFGDENLYVEMCLFFPRQLPVDGSRSLLIPGSAWCDRTAKIWGKSTKKVPSLAGQEL